MAEPVRMNERSRATLKAVHAAVVELILDGGVPAVTLSAVCRRAGLSKGGLMHHFPTKEAIVEFFVSHSCEGCLNETKTVLAQTSPGAGRRTRAFVDYILIDPAMCNPDASRDLAAVMIAMMQGAADDHAQRWYDTISRQLRGDDVPRTMVDLVIAAIDGLWLQSMVLPLDVVRSRADQLRRHLNRLIRQSANQKTQMT